jgi:hypothetical protein
VNIVAKSGVIGWVEGYVGFTNPRFLIGSSWWMHSEDWNIASSSVLQAGCILLGISWLSQLYLTDPPVLRNPDSLTNVKFMVIEIVVYSCKIILQNDLLLLHSVQGKVQDQRQANNWSHISCFITRVPFHGKWCKTYTPASIMFLMPKEHEKLKPSLWKGGPFFVCFQGITYLAEEFLQIRLWTSAVCLTK